MKSRSRNSSGKIQRRHFGLPEFDIGSCSSSGAGTCLSTVTKRRAWRSHDLDAVAAPVPISNTSPPMRLRRGMVGQQRPLEDEIVGHFARNPFRGVYLTHYCRLTFIPSSPDFDRAAFHQYAQRTFKDLFAHLRKAVHLLRGTVVVERQVPAVADHQLQQNLCRVLDLRISFLLEASRRYGCPR